MTTPSEAAVASRLAAIDRRSAGTGIAIAVIAGAQLMVALDVTIVNIALPHIQTALHFSRPSLAWVVDAATAPIAEQDIAAAAVRVLLDGGHAGARYVLTGGQSLTQAEQAQAIGAAIGRTLRVEELPAELFRRAAAAYMPTAAIDDLLRYLAGYVGRTAEMSPDLPTLTSRPATTFADWAIGRAASFR